MFIILRKRSLSFLHWYHHATVLLYTWDAFVVEQPPGIYFCAMNYTGIKSETFLLKKSEIIFICSSYILKWLYELLITSYSLSNPHQSMPLCTFTTILPLFPNLQSGASLSLFFKFHRCLLVKQSFRYIYFTNSYSINQKVLIFSYFYSRGSCDMCFFISIL